MPYSESSASVHGPTRWQKEFDYEIYDLDRTERGIGE